MATLHGILAELGIEHPTMHPEREAHHEVSPDIDAAGGWIVDEEFAPVVGRTYQLAFGRIPFGGEHKPVLKSVRIDGATPDQWFDIDEERRLDQALHAFPVKAYRQIG